MRVPRERIKLQFGTITKQADGRYNRYFRSYSIGAEIGILLNFHKAADGITNSRVVTQGIEIGAGWTHEGETSANDYVSL